MTITITAFERSPDKGQGLARDMRVRWALEEVGAPYTTRLVSFAAMKEPAHLALQPFGQIPTFEEDGLALFESGAIVLHIAGRHPGLLPDDGNARARAIAWMFAAVATVEPPIDRPRLLGGCLSRPYGRALCHAWSVVMADGRGAARQPTVMMLGLRGIPEVQGGVEKHVEELSRHFVDKGWDVTVLGRRRYLLTPDRSTDGSTGTI